MRKWISYILTACLTFTLLTGCTSDNKQGTTATGTSDKQTEDTNKDTQSKEPVTLTFMRTGTPEVLRAIFEPIIADFEKENPDIKIDMQDLGWGDAEKTLQVMASSKTLPDVMYHLPSNIFDMADKGLVLDLSSYMDEELKQDIYPSLLSAGQYNGNQYVIPCGATTALLWYNTELFKEAGLDPDNPPKTWDELLAAVEAIDSKTDASGIGMYAKSSGGETSFVFESLFAGISGNPTWDGSKYTYDLPENKEKAIQTLDLMQKLTAFAQPSVAEFGRFDTRTMLRDGTVGMVIDAINMQNQITQQLDNGTIKVTQLPTGGEKTLSTVNMGGWYIPTNSKHPDEAWKFLRFLMKTENQVKHSTYGSVPILKSEADSYSGEYWNTIIKSVDDSVAEGISPMTNALWTVTGEELQLLMLDKQTPQETLEHITKGHDEIYNK